jgi:NhaP-type Na+/H+ or K+/H+ antiporter
VLNSATPPIDPSKPRLLLNTLVSIILGALLGVAVALVVELTHRRIRSVQDLREALDLPSLGSVSSATALFGRTPPKALT